jgi:hypothetical protein
MKFMTTLCGGLLRFIAIDGCYSLDPGSEIRDGKKSKSGIRDKHPGSAKLVIILNSSG